MPLGSGPCVLVLLVLLNGVVATERECCCQQCGDCSSESVRGGEEWVAEYGSTHSQGSIMSHEVECKHVCQSGDWWVKKTTQLCCQKYKPGGCGVLGAWGRNTFFKKGPGLWSYYFDADVATKYLLQGIRGRRRTENLLKQAKSSGACKIDNEADIKRRGFKMSLSFSGGGTRSMAITEKILSKLPRQSYDAVAGISGGTWGITAFNNRRGWTQWQKKNSNMCMLQLVDLFDHACAEKLYKNNLLPQCGRIPKYKRMEYTYTKPTEDGMGLWGAAGVISACSSVFQDQTDPDKWWSTWSKWVKNYVGYSWDFNGRLKGKEVRAFFIMSDSASPSYTEQTELFYSTPCAPDVAKGSSVDMPFRLGTTCKHVKDFLDWVVVGSTAHTVDVARYLGLPVKIHTPVKLEKAYEVKVKGVKEPLYKFDQMMDAGFMLNNPFIVTDPAARKKEGPSHSIRIMFDHGQDGDYGWAEVERILQYMRRVGRPEFIRVISVCNTFDPCPPELSPVHIIGAPGSILIHAKVNSRYFGSKTTMMFPTSVMKYIPQEYQFLSEMVDPWVDLVVDLIKTLDKMKASELFKTVPQSNGNDIIVPNYDVIERLTKKLDTLDGGEYNGEEQDRLGSLRTIVVDPSHESRRRGTILDRVRDTLEETEPRRRPRELRELIPTDGHSV